MSENNVITTTAPASSVANSSAKVFNRAVADLKQGVTSATTATTAAVTNYSEKVASGARELTAFNKDTLAAITQANQIFFAGSQDLFRDIAQSSQAALNEAMSGFRALASVKTPKDGLELQASLIRASFARTLSESKRLVQASLQLAEKASAPLTARAA